MGHGTRTKVLGSDRGAGLTPLLGVPVAAALGAVTLWSTNALAASFALADLTVAQTVALQFGAATVVLLAIRVVRSGGRAGDRERPSATRVPAGHWLVGVVGILGTMSLQYAAFGSAPIVEANVIAYGWPLFAALWVAAAYRSARALLGVPLAVSGFLGMALILTANRGLELAGGATLGYLAALASAVCMTFYTLAVARVRLPVTDLLLPASAAGTAAALGLTFLGGVPWPPATGAWLAAAYAGAGPLAAGYALWTRAMSSEDARGLAPIGYATPLLSTGLLLASGEPFTRQTLLGALLVLACSVGVLVVHGKGRR